MTRFFAVIVANAIPTMFRHDDHDKLMYMIKTQFTAEGWARMRWFSTGQGAFVAVGSSSHYQSSRQDRGNYTAHTAPNDQHNNVSVYIRRTEDLSAEERALWVVDPAPVLAAPAPVDYGRFGFKRIR